MYQFQKIYLTRGLGESTLEAVSYRHALKDAGLGDVTINKLSQVEIPDNFKLITDKDEVLEILQGLEAVNAIVAHSTVNEFNRLFAAAIGYAVFAGKNTNGRNESGHTELTGHIVPYNGHGDTNERAGGKAETSAATLLLDDMGIDQQTMLETKDANLEQYLLADGWAVTKAQNGLSAQILRVRGDPTMQMKTGYIAQSGIGKSTKVYQTAIAAAVLLP